MENNFQKLIETLEICSSNNDNQLDELKTILEKQNSELLPLFISQLYQSLITLEHWVWQLFSENSCEWIENSNYIEFLHTLALFNKNLIFNYDNIEANIKACLLIPETIECIKKIFDNLEKMNDDNSSFINITSIWFDNLSFFLREYPEYDTSIVIKYMNEHMARNYIITDQYKLYLTELRQSPWTQSIYTAKQLFYIRTCSFTVASYLFAKAQDFIYTPEEILRHFGVDYIQIILLHTYSIDTWSSQLFTCITYLLVLFASCCWWGGEKGTQAKVVFSSQSAVCEYIDGLIRIIDYKPLYQRIETPLSNDETILLHTTLFALINIAQHDDFTWFLRSKSSLPETLMNIAETSECEKISLCTYGIIGEIFSNERLKELDISDNVSVFFFTILEKAWQNPTKKYKQIPIVYLLRAFVSLSKIDAVQQKTAETNRVALLIDMCDQYPIAYDILWALSFNHDIQVQIKQNSEFMTKLSHRLKKYDNEQIRKTIQGILWNLEVNHQDRTSSIMGIDNEKMFDIMISYSHRDELICRRIYDELIKVGYRIWIDFDQMHGNVMDAMAQAIEQSKTILICMSEEYRRSNYCRAEANYAFQRQLRIVPVLLQEHYLPDGWLLFLVGQLLYVDFTKYEFSQAIKLLIKEFQAPVINDIGVVVSTYSKEEINLGLSVPSMSPRCSLPELPENMVDWTETHVQDWLICHGLLQMSHLLANLDGRGLMYMNEFFENLDLQQVIPLLQEDSLRRTSQTLSLVELSCFRSLMDQQKRCTTSVNTSESRKNRQLTKLKNKSFRCCVLM